MPDSFRAAQSSRAPARTVLTLDLKTTPEQRGQDKFLGGRWQGWVWPSNPEQKMGNRLGEGSNLSFKPAV